MGKRRTTRASAAEGEGAAVPAKRKSTESIEEDDDDVFGSSKVSIVLPPARKRKSTKPPATMDDHDMAEDTSTIIKDVDVPKPAAPRASKSLGAGSSLGSVLSIQTTQELTMQLALMQDEISTLRARQQAADSSSSVSASNPAAAKLVENEFYKDYKRTCESKFDEYEKTIAQLRLDLAASSESEATLKSENQDIKLQLSEAALLTTKQASELSTLKRDLEDRTAEVDFLQAQVKEFDNKNGKINSAGKAAVAQLEAQVSASKASQVVEMYQRCTGMTITSVGKSECTDEDAGTIFSITHTGSANSLVYKLSVPEADLDTPNTFFTYYPVDNDENTASDLQRMTTGSENKANKKARPDYLAEVIEFKQLNLFFERVFAYVCGN